MAIDLIGSIASTQSASLNQAGLGQEDFLKILLTQLTYQDPMKPLDNQQFIAQMAQFSALEQSRQLNEKMDSLLVAQAATQSFGLLGKNVNFRTENGFPETGRVSSVNFRDGQALLTITVGNEPVEGVRLSAVTSVIAQIQQGAGSSD